MEMSTCREERERGWEEGKISPCVSKHPQQGGEKEEGGGRRAFK